MNSVNTLADMLPHMEGTMVRHLNLLDKLHCSQWNHPKSYILSRYHGIYTINVMTLVHITLLVVCMADRPVHVRVTQV